MAELSGLPTTSAAKPRAQSSARLRPTQRSPRGTTTWSPALDQCLRSGLAQGRRGVREATDRVLTLYPMLTRAQCWRRLRWLRERSGQTSSEGGEWPAALIERLREGYREGGGLKRAAFRTIRAHYPDLPGYVILRMARQHGCLTKATEPAITAMHRRWTDSDQRNFSGMAERRCVSQMAQALGRTPRAIRWRLAAQGLSAKPTGAWPLHTLERIFHVSHSTMRRWIADHCVRVQDAHITSASLRVFVAHQRQPECATETARSPASSHEIVPDRTYRWKDAAMLANCDIAAVREAVAHGMLKLVDSKVGDRALETFCRRDAVKYLNFARLDPAIRQWLMDEYHLPAKTDVVKAKPIFHNQQVLWPLGLRHSHDDQHIIAADLGARAPMHAGILSARSGQNGNKAAPYTAGLP